METPGKRLYTEVDSDSSPEISLPKRPMGDIEAIRQAIQGIQAQLGTVSELKDLALSTNDTLSQLKGSLNGLVARVNTTEKMVNQLSNENTLLKRRVSQLEEKALHQEAYDRRDNLILDGISYQVKENIESKVREILRVTLKIPNADSIMFTRVHRLANSNKTIVRFHYYKDREAVWAQRRCLKGSGLWLEEDFPMEWRNKRQILYPIMKIARSIRDVKATLSKDKLIINSEVYTVDTLAKLPQAIDLSSVLNIHEDNVYFSSKSSPLSNFYPAQFRENGIQYNCAEQYYQEAKASVNGDSAAADEIHMMSDPVAIYKRAKAIKVDQDKWTEGKRLESMEKALTLKFAQNPHLKQVLLSTGRKQIWEARPQDNFFGAGVTAADLKSLKPDDVPGTNHLGNLLMRVRDHLAADCWWWLVTGN